MPNFYLVKKVLAAAPGPVASGFGQRADMNMGSAVAPDKIGVPILAALGKQTNVIPGLLSKVLVYSLRTVPRFVKVKIMEKIMGALRLTKDNKPLLDLIAA